MTCAFANSVRVLLPLYSVEWLILLAWCISPRCWVVCGLSRLFPHPDWSWDLFAHKPLSDGISIAWGLYLATTTTTPQNYRSIWSCLGLGQPFIAYSWLAALVPVSQAGVFPSLRLEILLTGEVRDTFGPAPCKVCALSSSMAMVKSLGTLPLS